MQKENVPAETPYAEIYKECFQKTGVRYGPLRKPWHPRLRSFNDLELEDSQLYYGPIGHLLWYCVELWNWLTAAYKAIHRFVFPRRKRIYGHPTPFNVVSGRLTFGQKEQDLDVPVYNMNLQLWARTLWGGYRKIGEGFSDRDGNFALPYDLLYVRRWWMYRVWLGIYQTGYEHFHGKKREPDFYCFQNVKIKKGDLVGINLSVGTIQLFYWEYRTDTPLPRVVIEDHDKNAPDTYAPGRTPLIESIFVPIDLIKVKHLEMIRLDPGALTMAQLQADYPENLTVCMEKIWPGSTRSDAWFGYRMMNGMNAAAFDRDPRNPDLYWTHYHWSSYDKNLHYYAMPDVDIWFRLQENGLPIPVKITLTGPLRATDTDPRSKHTFTPDDGEKWLAAKRVARVSGALYTELAHHFAVTHINTEQFAIAAFRNLRLNPVAGLLKSFLRGVVLVNHTADRILVGNGYITSACALTPKGITQVVEQQLGGCDWKDYRPMPPISHAHEFAFIANLYWDIVYAYVKEFLNDPDYRPQILEHWHEIYRFSDDLVKHSVPFFLCKYLTRQLLNDDGTPKPDYGHNWYQTANRTNLHTERPVYNGVPKALSRITDADDAAHVTEKDWENLLQACTYIIYQATFGHTWANSKQYDDIGEVLYNSLGLRFGTGPDGVLGPESDLSIAPDLTRSTQMMWWANMLSRSMYGFIMSNEDGDISPRLIEMLGAHREQFKQWGFDIDIIQSRTNI